MGDGPLGPTRLVLDKPVIAAVTGFAVAGGLELALWCDLRVVDETATFGVFCRRYGIPLVDGGTARLPRAIGLARALDLILTGRAVGAQEALAIGLASRVVPAGTALAEATALAQQLAAFPQACMRADRRAALGALDSPLADALALEARSGQAVFHAEGKTGAARFVEGMGRHGSFDVGDD